MATSFRTVLSDVVPEGVTSLLSGSLVDESGAALGSGQLATFKLTLYRLTAGRPVINSRSAISILNTGPGTIDAGGAWTITLDPADNAIAASSKGSESHRALLEWTYGVGGTKSGKHEIEFLVQNLDKV